MAQLGGIVMMDPENAAAKKNFFFGGIDGCKFRRPVVPGDTLVRCMPKSAVSLRQEFYQNRETRWNFMDQKSNIIISRAQVDSCGSNVCESCQSGPCVRRSLPTYCSPMVSSSNDFHCVMRSAQ